MNQELLEERVERLEYYINLLRNCTFVIESDNLERFMLWDWVMSHRLNRQEVDSILDYVKSIAKQMKESDHEDDYPTVEQFATTIKSMVYQELRDDQKIIVDRGFFMGLFHGLLRIGKYKFEKLVTYYSSLKDM
ncbi:DUF1878 family protein [Paenibacillus popilliae]|uniref:Uncharacterized protein n=1 Tax=Paenibacillus popilliae ATCC 14706 TaxID=1212764 RepID=M9M120_PAEPP|nr:DUF1878 family protein [Paenibacillus popilliae]GAC42569.1 hypothetical protein PPOP_1926 [Paenibacillus popilliae ATCC 14706]